MINLKSHCVIGENHCWEWNALQLQPIINTANSAYLTKYKNKIWSIQIFMHCVV